MDKRLENRFAADDAIAGDFDLIRPQQKHAGGILEKLRAVIRRSYNHNAAKTQNENAPVERPASPRELFAADFDRLLSAQVARLILGNQLRPIGIGFRRG